MMTRFAVKVSVVATVVAVSGLALTMSSGTPTRESVAQRTVTAEEKDLLYRAEERLIRRCMAEHGFEYHERPPEPSVTTGRTFSYVVDDVAWARRNGYGQPSPDKARGASNAKPPYLRGLSPERLQAWQKTLLGEGRQVSVELPGLGRFSTSNKGCMANARRTLYGDLPRWYRARRIVDHLHLLVYPEVLADHRYQAAVTEWAICMRKAGHSVADPVELRETLYRQTHGKRPRAVRAIQIQTAVNEARCANSTPFSRVVHGLEREYKWEVNAAYGPERMDLNALERAALTRARDVMRGL